MRLNKLLLSYQFSQMKSYLHVLETTFSTEIEEIEKEFEARYNSDETEEDEWLIDKYQDAILLAGIHYPRHALTGFLITLYAFIEQTLISICSRKNLKVTFAIDEPINYGKGISKVKFFLKESLGYEFDPQQWQTLTNPL